jgi:(4S)-4-hydroxy-5-phosphonooxypentane-2,3-dione isomerase
MFVVCVNLQVKPEHLDAFLQATLENARATRKEPLNARFDVLQAEDDPTRFMLYEVYRERSGHAEHQKTAHYLAWREKVPPLLATPRVGVKLKTLFPDDGGF